MNKLDQDYLNICKDILHNGIEKEDRTGTGTISKFGNIFTYVFQDDKFPILTTKKMAWKNIVIELLWFLNGRSDLRFLINNNCHIWDGDAYRNYKNTKISDIKLSERGNNFKIDDLKLDKNNNNYIHYTKEEFINKIKTDDIFSEKWGDMMAIYGKSWRNWNGIDQIKNLINDLKNNPDSRRLMVNSWNVEEINNYILPPCHFNFQCYTELIEPRKRIDLFNKYIIDNNLDIRNISIEQSMDYYKFPTRKLSLMYNSRSIDIPLGFPFNISSYGLLMKIICSIINMIPDNLICSMGDNHIYLNQIESITEQINRLPYDLPKLYISPHLKDIDNIDEFLEKCNVDDFKLIDYKYHPTIKIPLSN